MKRLALMLCLLAPHAFAGDTVEIVDGDTLLLDGSEVGLFGIDAPELGALCRRGSDDSDCGVLARAALLDLTAGAEVVCNGVNGAPGKVLCRANGYDLSEGMIYTGWARALAGEGRRYVALEGRARIAERGLWSGFELLSEE
ncbi:MAG: thermonuclease family protein [Alphaproteobacteria bacterium]|jgi:endonuclease YncB( thermonuclease family)|nr:thermonuclease family protein [Alphaproteobacteria bacterium]